MSPKTSELLRWIISAMLMLVALFVLVSWLKPSADDNAAVLIDGVAQTAMLPSATTVSLAPVPTPTAVQIAIDVIGAVQQPGVYYLPERARVVDAIDAAGGLAPYADRDGINLAALVTDGQQLRVPEIGDATESAAVINDDGALTQNNASSLININTADTQTLEQLSGVGPVTAQAIIEYREANGPFQEIDDLENVSRIGPRTIDKFRDQVTVGP